MFVSTTHAHPAWHRSALQEATISVTLNSVTVNISDSNVTPIAIDLYFTCSDTLVLQTISSFSFAIAYDPATLSLFDVLDNGLRRECGWSFNWYNVNNDSLPSNKYVLRLVGNSDSGLSAEGLACLTSENPLITIEFITTIDLSQYDESTTVDFVWLNCHDNTIGTKENDEIPQKLLAFQIFDAGGVDITDENNSLPSYCGPNTTCFEPFGDTLVARTVSFHNGKIKFKSLTHITTTRSDEGGLPSLPMLHQNYPNPFNPATTIEFYLPERTDWHLEIFNLSGRLVSKLSGTDGPGNVVLNWNGRDAKNQIVSSGVYFYRLITDKYRSSKKMLLLK